MTATNCIFCKIISKEIPGNVRYEDENWLCFDDLYKAAPEHVLLVPKKHFATLEDIGVKDHNFHAELILTTRKIAKKLRIGDNYKIFMNIGSKVQAVHHLHLHIYGGWDKGKPSKEIDQESWKLINE